SQPHVKRENFLTRMAEQKEPVPFHENGPSSYPLRQHHQRNHHGNQEQNVGGFPNQYFTDVHCRLSITKPVALLLSFPGPVRWTFRTSIESPPFHAPRPHRWPLPYCPPKR